MTRRPKFSGRPRPPYIRLRWFFYGALGIVLLFFLFVAGRHEMETSDLQSRSLSWYAKDLTYAAQAKNFEDASFYPATGPYNQRLGYTSLPQYLQRARASDYAVVRQAHPSPAMASFVQWGGFAPYKAKTQAGLILKDRTGIILYNALYPERVYDQFQDVPPLVANTLLFIENRELLDAIHPRRNPAVEWDRLASALLSLPFQWITPSSRIAGGSTLATQIEKYRHSPFGRTDGMNEKFRQMVSASVRAYLNGPDTTSHRRQVVVDYLNSTPLTARGSFGEVNGLGDGLWAWFGTDFRTANRLLRLSPQNPTQLMKKAFVYKQVLALLLAQRRPSYYLTTHRAALETLVNSHLRVLTKEGIIDVALQDAALAMPLTFAKNDPQPDPVSFVDQKAPNAIRNHLLSLLGISKLYQLDRTDLSVDTTLDLPTQERVIAFLHQLKSKNFLEKNDLVGLRLLENSDPADVIYSFTLLERRGNANFVRVQADNLDQPLDINERVKLDLGSTAKLRTLCTYLDIMAELHRRHASRSRQTLRDLAEEASDPLTRWALEHLANSADRNLIPFLNSAMKREYSASPGERFFTGGGVHTFVNFDSSDNSKIVTVAEALRHSINLPFIRLMRDIVAFYRAESVDSAADVLVNGDHPARQEYLQRFADKEGRVYLNQFYQKYAEKSSEEALTFLARRIRPTPERLAVVYRSVRPAHSLDKFSAFVKAHLPDSSVVSGEQLKKLYAKHAPGKFNLADRGYLARVHPLELWLVQYLQEHPFAPRADIIKASEDQRQESYAWLFKTRSKSSQNTRIRMLMEEEAFQHIHKHWTRLGYPFDRLVPSYATAIGSSADKPDALAELMGIILNDGINVPTVRIRQLHFAEDTPYETLLRRQVDDGERVMVSEVAQVLQSALADVVNEGTAQRVKDAFVSVDGQVLSVGGKTGTGDHRFEKFGSGGRLVESRVVNRTATFVFYIGDNFFGVITAHVQGEKAARYKFTSALPAQLLKALTPALLPLIQGKDTVTSVASAVEAPP